MTNDFLRFFHLIYPLRYIYNQPLWLFTLFTWWKLHVSFTSNRERIFNSRLQGSLPLEHFLMLEAFIEEINGRKKSTNWICHFFHKPTKVAKKVNFWDFLWKLVTTLFLEIGKRKGGCFSLLPVFVTSWLSPTFTLKFAGKIALKQPETHTVLVQTFSSFN